MSTFGPNPNPNPNPNTAADSVKPMEMTGWVIVDYVFWVPSQKYAGKYHCITKNYKKSIAMNGSSEITLV